MDAELGSRTHAIKQWRCTQFRIILLIWGMFVFVVAGGDDLRRGGGGSGGGVSLYLFLCMLPR